MELVDEVVVLGELVGGDVSATEVGGAVVVMGDDVVVVEDDVVDVDVVLIDVLPTLRGGGWLGSCVGSLIVTGGVGATSFSVVVGAAVVVVAVVVVAIICSVMTGPSGSGMRRRPSLGAPAKSVTATAPTRTNTTPLDRLKIVARSRHHAGGVGSYSSATSSSQSSVTKSPVSSASKFAAVVGSGGGHTPIFFHPGQMAFTPPRCPRRATFRPWIRRDVHRPWRTENVSRRRHSIGRPKGTTGVADHRAARA